MSAIREHALEIESQIDRHGFKMEGDSFTERLEWRQKFNAALRLILLEVARDQRHADAESLTECRKLVMGSKQRVFIDLDEARQAVMNATIEDESKS